MFKALQPLCKSALTHHVFNRVYEAKNLLIPHQQ